MMTMYRPLVLLCLVELTVAYKILVSYPFPAKSVNNLGEAITRHLLKAGHEVTYITAYPRHSSTNPNLRQIDVSDNLKFLANDDHVNITFILESDVEISTDTEFLQDMAWKIAVNTLENPNVRKILEDPKETFDVVVNDLLETELLAGFAALYDVPLIWSYSMGAHWLALRLVDDPSNPAYSTDYLTSVAPPFSFGERFQVLWTQIKWRYTKYFKIMPKEEESYKNIFGPLVAKRGRKLPGYGDLIYNASLVLSNEHYASGRIPKTPQNWKLVGGFHIQHPPNPLEKDLQTFMDNAKNGVIYFSMGSIWKSESIPKRLTDELLEMFGSLKETVLWKYEADLPNLPKNVHTIKWAPQQSILAHPNCKIFISHGGLLSSTEAIHFGVPTIGVPVSYDQHINIDKAVKRGYALRVNLAYDLAKELKSAIGIIINEPKYKENAKYLSSIYHDRPLPPGQELVYWVEHVVRTRGATHLRSPALDVPFYQKAYLDVIAGLFIAIIIVMHVFKAMCGKPKRVKKTKLN